MFHTAYQANPEWALANLTTWLVYVGAAAALANVAVVVSAFHLQTRQFQRDKRVRDTETARTCAAAIRAAQNALEVFDVAVGGKNNDRTEFSRSDLIGRMTTFQGMIAYYLSLKIVNPGVIDCLFTVQTLVNRTILDLHQLQPLDQDRFPKSLADQIYNHRRTLRDGTEKMINLMWQSPAIEPEVL